MKASIQVALATGVVGVVTALTGWRGLAYAAVLCVVAVAGQRLAGRVFGRRHPAALIVGAPVGYGLFALSVWGLMALHAVTWLTCLVALIVLVSVASWIGRRSNAPLIVLPRWNRQTTRALTLLVALTLLITAVPFARIGERDADGTQRYRAYFTADFVWHRAVVGELARLNPRPQNPYFSGRPLHYYWTYFLPPAVVVGLSHPSPGPQAPITEYLIVTALFSAVSLVSMIFLLAWVVVPRAGPAALATVIVWLASSGEGLWALVRYWLAGTPVSDVRYLNIDALTYWWLDGLTVDSLSRTLWYNPQHAMASALGLVAVVIAARARHRRPATGVFAFAGVCLGLSLTMSPFPAAVYGLVYGVTLGWSVLTRRCDVSVLLKQWAVVPTVALALAWHIANGMSGGPGSRLVFGFSERASHHPLATALLAIGPLLLWVGVGLGVVVRSRLLGRLGVSLVGTAVCASLFYLLTLELESIWVGWRSAQVWLTLMPPIIAVTIEAGRRVRPRWALASAAIVVIAVALPTTAIDWFNAQDVSNDAPGPGFRWTIGITPDEQDAFAWIERHTPANAVVQMSLTPRGRETWSAIPSFARRRMAAGLPISLFRTDADTRSADAVDELFSVPNAGQAAAIARGAGIDFVYVGRVEQQFHPDLIARLRSRPDLFQVVFENHDVALIRVTCTATSPCRN